MGVVEVEVEGEEGQEEEVEVEAVVEGEEVEEAGVEVAEGPVKTMQITPTPKGSLLVGTRNPRLQQ